MSEIELRHIKFECFGTTWQGFNQLFKRLNACTLGPKGGLLVSLTKLTYSHGPQISFGKHTNINFPQNTCGVKQNRNICGVEQNKWLDLPISYLLSSLWNLNSKLWPCNETPTSFVDSVTFGNLGSQSNRCILIGTLIIWDLPEAHHGRTLETSKHSFLISNENYFMPVD